MNTTVATLLRTLDSLGVQRVGFRILSHGKRLRHTNPVALSTGSRRSGPPLAILSISDLFAAYALAPHKGDYVLNVEDGALAFTPAVARTAAATHRAAKFKGHRARAKQRVRRRHPAAAQHKLAA